jgi:hypothetical protein
MISQDDLAALERAAQYERSALVVVGAATASDPVVPILSVHEFLGRLGGPVPALIPLEREYPERLRVLGHNALPSGLAGKADTIFEQYVHAGLQFILQDRVLRYGQDRLFEALPDGLVAGHRSPLMLYDAKAAKYGYDVTVNSIRQFADYVRKFHSRYETFTGRLYAFLLISGDFAAEGTLEERSAQLFSECGVPLRTVTSEEMSKIVALFAERPSYRQAVDWKNVFSKTVITEAVVEENLKARIQDGVIARRA